MFIRNEATVKNIVLEIVIAPYRLIADGYRLYTGVDPVTGEELTSEDRLMGQSRLLNFDKINDFNKINKAFSGNKGKINPSTVIKQNRHITLTQGNSKFGWEHIHKNHVSGQVSNKTLFPKHLDESKLKNIIMDSISKGRHVYTTPDGFKEYVYNLNKYGISEMRTIVSPDGNIWTSYPTKGTSVIRTK